MRKNILKFAYLAGMLILGTGAATQGIRQAEQWHREAEVARAVEQWDIVYDRAFVSAQAFPGTPHGRLGVTEAREARDRMINPDRSPASDDPVSWTHEALDFFTWP